MNILYLFSVLSEYNYTFEPNDHQVLYTLSFTKWVFSNFLEGDFQNRVYLLVSSTLDFCWGTDMDHAKQFFTFLYNPNWGQSKISLVQKIACNWFSANTRSGLRFGNDGKICTIKFYVVVI